MPARQLGDRTGKVETASSPPAQQPPPFTTASGRIPGEPQPQLVPSVPLSAPAPRLRAQEQEHGRRPAEATTRHLGRGRSG